MNKIYLPVVIIFLLILIGVSLYLSFFSRSDIGPNEAILTIDFGKEKRAFAGETIEGMTVFDVLLVSSEAGNIDFDFKDGVLKRIGAFQENGKKWNLYFNGKKIEDSLDQVLIKAGDKIELKFE